MPEKKYYEQRVRIDKPKPKPKKKKKKVEWQVGLSPANVFSPILVMYLLDLDPSFLILMYAIFFIQKIFFDINN